jgi:hypothetical protein
MAKKEKKVKQEIKEVIRLGKCLRCGKPMVKNHMSCVSCRKKQKLMKKANRCGKPKYHYLK